MRLKHYGSFKELVRKIKKAGGSPYAKKKVEKSWHVYTEDGPIVIWYYTTGTVVIQGKNPDAREKLEDNWPLCRLWIYEIPRNMKA